MFPSFFIKLLNSTTVQRLLVAGLIALLVALIIVLSDPLTRLQEKRDERREQDLVHVREAMEEYRLHHGEYPEELDETTDKYQVLGSAIVGCDTTCGAVPTVTACVDLSVALGETALSSPPEDPKTGSQQNTDYAINVETDGRLRLVACDPEGEGEISLRR